MYSEKIREGSKREEVKDVKDRDGRHCRFDSIIVIFVSDYAYNLINAKIRFRAKKMQKIDASYRLLLLLLLLLVLLLSVFDLFE